YIAQVRQQPHTEAWAAVPCVRYKRYSRYTGAFWPCAARRIRNSEQGLPHIGIAIGHAIGHLGPLVDGIAQRALSPPRHLISDRLPFLRMNTVTPGFDFFIRGTAPHPDDDRTRQDGIRQPTEAC